MKNLGIKQSSFGAWSIYTGPSELEPIVENSNWVLGRWNAINNSLQPAEIIKDIDARIDAVIEAFTTYCQNTNALNKHFTIPQFFFRCKQGPYPYIKLNELYPIDYIKTQFNNKLLNAIQGFPESNTTYTVVLGSILTSNIEDYQSFWNSEGVQGRLARLNSALKSQVKQRKTTMALKKAPLKSAPEHFSWKRQMIYKPKKHKLKALRQAAITAQQPDLDEWMKGFRASPLCTVRNRGIFYYYGTQNFTSQQKSLEIRVYEKKYESTVDLTMGVIKDGVLTHGNMITQWMGNYPSYSTYQGDKQTGQIFETNARFDYTQHTYKKFDIGVEICLDHRLQRLRRTVGMNIKNGANLNNYPIYKQFVPSGGMQILSQSVSLNGSSVIFNSDGCEPVYYEYTSNSPTINNGNSGVQKSVTCGVYTLSYQSKWEPSESVDEQVHYSHSQIAFTTPDSTINGYNNELGEKNKQCDTCEQSSDRNAVVNYLTDSFSVISIKLPAMSNKQDSAQLFCSGLGELHLYSYQSDTHAKNA